MDDNIKLEVVDWGGKGTPLVFLAGLALNAHTFDPLVSSFVDSYRVIGITRVGHGNSESRKENFSTARLTKDIITILNKMNIDKAIFAGHSFAGGELNHLGRHFPERVRGLIYMDAIQDLDYMDSHLAVCPDLGYATIDVLKHQDNFYNTQRIKNPDGSYLPYADISVLGKLINEEEDRHYSEIAAPAIAISHIPEQTEDFFIGLGNPTQKCFEEMNKLTYLGIASFIKNKQNADVAAIQNSQHMIHMATPEKLVMVMKSWLARTFATNKPINQDK
ncbi:alpha/beta fold hydrolase [Colwellia sp. TT2012]|uniref:alpha/beta fold hydrolase n=1 Tax=Colwellia sp. TT2012 TaxID=1720342 RepID=UPI0018D271B3|nr:alpha/beta hydrolase [Colwellia sp. TT2012]